MMTSYTGTYAPAVLVSHMLTHMSTYVLPNANSVIGRNMENTIIIVVGLIIKKNIGIHADTAENPILT